MATRMQQRRGTAQQWTDADPILAAGEIGYETDTNQFKIGDGTNVWSTLSYFKNLEDLGGTLDDYIPLTQKGQAMGVATLNVNGQIPASQLGIILDNAPEAYDTLSEIATALQTGNTELGSHTNATTNVHGIGDTSELATNESVTTAVNSAIGTHTQDTTNVHGIADMTALITSDGVDTKIAAEIGVHNNDTTSVHGIADTSVLETQTGAQSKADAAASSAVSDHNLDTTNVHGISDTAALATKSYADTAVSDHSADTTSVHGIADTAALATKTYADGKASDAETAAATSAASLYATKVDAAITGTATVENITVTGNLTVQGTTTTVDATNLEVTDSLIYLAAEQFDTDALDIGIFGAYGDVQTGHNHTGLVRDASDGKWKLISAGPEPVSNVIDFSSVTYDTIKLGGVEFSDGTQTKQGVPSLTNIIQKTAGYTLSSLTERDSMIEVASSSGVSVTIPADSSLNFPVGTSIDILQTSTGQVTIAAAGGVTVNATPGLKLRTQWSSATLVKRAANTWVVMGDLTA
jgi:hypothetical protein